MDEIRSRVPIRVPALGLESHTLTLTAWLVPAGAHVSAGDRIVEILTGEAVVDLPARCSGVLVEQQAAEDDVVQTGQVLGWIETLAPPT